MFVDMNDVWRIRKQTHVVEIEHQYWLDFEREEVITALGESYFYMMAHEFPGFRTLGRHLESTVVQDIDTNVTKFAVWWAPFPGECYFPELGYGCTFDLGQQRGPRRRLVIPKQPDLRAFPKPSVGDESVMEDLTDNYYVEGWSDTVHAWIYKKGK